MNAMEPTETSRTMHSRAIYAQRRHDRACREWHAARRQFGMVGDRERADVIAYLECQADACIWRLADLLPDAANDGRAAWES